LMYTKQKDKTPLGDNRKGGNARTRSVRGESRETKKTQDADQEMTRRNLKKKRGVIAVPINPLKRRTRKEEGRREQKTTESDSRNCAERTISKASKIGCASNH